MEIFKPPSKCREIIWPIHKTCQYSIFIDTNLLSNLNIYVDGENRRVSNTSHNCVSRWKRVRVKTGAVHIFSSPRERPPKIPNAISNSIMWTANRKDYIWHPAQNPKLENWYTRKLHSVVIFFENRICSPFDIRYDVLGDTRNVAKSQTSTRRVYEWNLKSRIEQNIS